MLSHADVRSLIAFVLVAALILSQGTSLAASICRHAGYDDHVAARQSHDLRKAAVAYAEETAGAVASKKGSASSASSIAQSVDLLPASVPAAEPYPRINLPPHATDRPPLVGLLLRPPVPPPLA